MKRSNKIVRYLDESVKQPKAIIPVHTLESRENIYASDTGPAKRIYPVTRKENPQ